MISDVPVLACRERLRSRDKYKEEKKIRHSDDEEEEEEEEAMRKDENNLKYKEEKKTWTGEKVKNREDEKMKKRWVSTTIFEKKKKKKMLSSHNCEKKMHSGDHDKDERRNNAPFLFSSDQKERRKKMLSSQNGEKKMGSGDHDKDKMRSMTFPLNKNKMQKDETKKRMAPMACAVKEKKMRPSDCMEMKMQKCDNKEDKKKRSAPPILYEEDKIQKLANNKKGKKRKESPLSFNKGKKMRADDKDKNVWSDDKWKEQKLLSGGKEHKVQSAGKEKKRNAPLAFFKVICNNIKEFLSIPPSIAPKLVDLTNHHVYLEDSEGKSSKIRLSVLDGSLAFHQGWSNFVSDHLIKWGDFLLFEYTGMSKFSVRVFGTDSCERLCFIAERTGGRKKQKESHTLDDLVPCYMGRNSEDINHHCNVSAKYPGSKELKTTADVYIRNNGKITPCNSVAKSMNAASKTHRMTGNTKEHPNRVLSAPAVLDNKDGNLTNGEYKAKNISPACSKGKTRRPAIILITDAAPLTQGNEDTVKLTTLTAASEMHHTIVDTKQYPKKVASGAWGGPSVAVDKEQGKFSIVECKAKSISPMCSKEKTGRSETIIIANAAPSKMATADGHIMKNVKISPSNSVAKSVNAASETHRMTGDTKENPNRVVSEIGRGPSTPKALDNKDGNLANGEYKAKNNSPVCSKGKTRTSGIILITDAAPLTQQNEDTVNQTTMSAPSEMHHATFNTKQCPKEVASGAWGGPSVTIANEQGISIGECKSKSISPTCSKEKTRGSERGPETIIIPDAAPSTQENDDKVKLTTFPHHKEDRSRITKSVPEVASPTKCVEIHDSDEDLTRKQKRNTVQLECTTVGDKCPYNSKMKTNGNVCRTYEAPGGSRCLEKWKKGPVSATFDVTGLIRPENPQETDEKLVRNCGEIVLNPLDRWLLGSDGNNSCLQPMPDKISESGHSRTEIDHSANGKGSTVQCQTKREQLKPAGSIGSKRRNNIHVLDNHAVARQSEHHSFPQEDMKSSNYVTPVALLPVKAEVLELDDQLHSLLKINLQFCIPSTTQKWLELPNSLSTAVRQKERQDRKLIMLKDPMKRLWPVFYHKNSLFVGFTAGWKPFAAANNLQTGDLCMLFKELDEEEPVYRVQITRK